MGPSNNSHVLVPGLVVSQTKTSRPHSRFLSIETFYTGSLTRILPDIGSETVSDQI